MWFVSSTLVFSLSRRVTALRSHVAFTEAGRRRHLAPAADARIANQAIPTLRPCEGIRDLCLMRRLLHHRLSAYEALWPEELAHALDASTFLQRFGSLLKRVPILESLTTDSGND